MTDLLQRLKQRKIVQWAIAYVAGAWVVLQVLQLVGGEFGWPAIALRIITVVLAIGFFVTLVLAWYHGDRGAQRVGGIELVMLAALLVIAAVAVTWVRHQHFLGGTQVAGVAAPAAAVGKKTPASIPPATSAKTQSIPPMAPIAAPPIPAKSVAVLPFESLSADKNNAYFADGMQDLILTKLADIGDLKVIARTSTMQYGSHPQNLTLVGQQLGVATILEGSVQKAGKQVLINVQLIDVKTDSHIWAESYTRTLDNIFGVEGEVAQKVATALNAKLTAQETAAVNHIPTTNPQAYVLYLKAQHEMSMVFTASAAAGDALIQKAANDLRQAVALDPNFAAAYGNLAFLELFATPLDKRVSTQPWMTHARKALSLQPDSPIALVAIGRWQFRHGKAGPGLQALQKAARLAPGNAIVIGELTDVYQLEGAWQQADDAAREAVRVDPRNAPNYRYAAQASMALRHYADARQMLERGLAVSPDDPRLHETMGTVLLLLGDFAGARAKFVQLPAGPGFDKFYVLAYVWRVSRNCTAAIKAARRMPSPPRLIRHTGWRDTLIGRCELTLGDQARGRATLSRARAAIQAVLREHPHTVLTLRDQAYLRDNLAQVEAWLGNRDAALQAVSTAITLEARRYTELWKQFGLPPTSKGLRMYTANFEESKAEILAHFGDAKGATDILGQLLPTPGIYDEISPALLRLDPVWDPIRHDSRFQALLKEYGTAAPVGASTTVPAASPVSTSDEASETLILPVIPAQAGIHFDLRST